MGSSNADSLLDILRDNDSQPELSKDSLPDAVERVRRVRKEIVTFPGISAAAEFGSEDALFFSQMTVRRDEGPETPRFGIVFSSTANLAALIGKQESDEPLFAQMESALRAEGFEPIPAEIARSSPYDGELRYGYRSWFHRYFDYE